MADDNAPDVGPGRSHDEDRPPVNDPQGWAIANAAVELRAVRTGATVLKVVAAIAFGLWLLAIITVFWNNWQLSDTGRMTSTLGLTTGSMDNERILQVISSTLTSTWGYLLAGIVAYGASMALHAQRMRLLVDAASVDD